MVPLFQQLLHWNDYITAVLGDGTAIESTAINSEQDPIYFSYEADIPAKLNAKIATFLALNPGEALLG